MPSMRSVILGLSGPYHESAACLLVDGKVACMVEEERLVRIRHGKPARIDNAGNWPKHAVESCLQDANLSFRDVDHVVYPFLPNERLRNIGCDSKPVQGDWGSPAGEHRFVNDILAIESVIRSHSVGARFEFHFVPHHLAHAASAFFPSPFEQAAVLTVDGIGEFDTTWLGQGGSDSLCPHRTLHYPHSLGFLWEVVSDALGFGPTGATKVMGLAAYGDRSRYQSVLSGLVTLPAPGAFAVDGEALAFRAPGPNWVARVVPEALATQNQPLGQASADLAAALQHRTEEVLLHLARWLRQKTGCRQLCLAGGVALNCAANGRLAQAAVFDELFVQPAAHDAGTALGAALLFYHRTPKPRWRMTTARLGPRQPIEAAKQAARLSGLPWRMVQSCADEAAERLARGQTVGIYRTDRCEVGPRALGGRSLLADPRHRTMRDHINLAVKHREPFRPFGPAVLAEHAEDFFQIPPASRPLLPFMLAAVPVKPDRVSGIAAVVHRDHTTRPQLVQADGSAYRALIERFYERTGVPMVLNTSLNVQEPIVETPDQAVRLVSQCGLDAVLLDDILVVGPAETMLDAAPAAERRFEPTLDRYGKRLALVFGNENRDGACPFWQQRQCNHCDIGRGEGQSVQPKEHARRLAWFAHHYRQDVPTVEHLLFYNSGSVLNPKEMSPWALETLCEQVASWPALRMLSIETREAFVQTKRLRPLLARLGPKVALRVVLGLESADDEVRLVHLAKRMPAGAVEHAARELAACDGPVGLWLNLVFAPPGRTGQAAETDLLAGIRFGVALSQKYGLPLDFNIHPFYPSQRSVQAFPSHPRADSSALKEAVASAQALLNELGSGASLFIGWQDERHDQQPTRRFSELANR